MQHLLFLSIVKEILRLDSFSVNDEDFESQTALHLASIHGHYKVVSLLIKEMADIQARNCYLWTPLDCAAAYGWTKCTKILLDVGLKKSLLANLGSTYRLEHL